MIDEEVKSVIYVTITYIVLYYIFLYMQSFITFYRYFKYNISNKDKDKKVKLWSIKYDKTYSDKLSLTGRNSYIIISINLLQLYQYR